MGTLRREFDPRAFIPDTTNAARFVVNAGSNFPVLGLAFDASTAQICYALFRLAGYASGSLTLSIFWYADTASSGDVKWGAAIACVTPDTDTQDIETKSFTTEDTVTDSHLGTTGQRLHQCSITISDLDSAAAADFVALKFRRIAADGADTMTGDAIVVGVEMSYSS